MQNFQGNFKTRKRSFISAFSVYMTVPLDKQNQHKTHNNPNTKAHLGEIL